MPAPQRGGGPGELGRFRRLAIITALATFPLIVIGGVVRVSEAGLGCGPAGSGTHGWPLCEGQVLPLVGGISGETGIEFTHRALAAVVGIMVLLLAWRAWRGLRRHRVLLWGSVGAGVLVLAQAVLGGLTVEHNLEPALVAAHLGLAMVLLAMLVALASISARISSASRPGMRGRHPTGGVVSDHGASSASPSGVPEMERRRSVRDRLMLRWGDGAAMREGSTPWLRAVAALASLLILATIVSGGYVAGTEGEGTVNKPAAGAHLACGQEFPGCAGRFMPFGLHPLIDAQLTHRLLMYLAAIAVLAMITLALLRGIRHWILPAAGIALAGQILLGALNVWLGKHAGLIVAHLTLGTIVWTIVSYAAIMLVPLREPAPDARTAPAEPEPATA